MTDPAPCPLCGGEVPQSTGRGRPRRFCTAACSKRFHRRSANPLATPRAVTLCRVRRLDEHGNVVATRYYASGGYAEARARKWAALGFAVALDLSTEPIAFAVSDPLARQSTRVLPMPEVIR